MAELESPWKAIAARRDEREEKRRAVLRTAAKAFCQKGVTATSLDDIAKRLNITKPTLYRYYDSKSAILNACVQAGLDMIEDSLARSAGTARTGRERLVVALCRYAEIMTMDFGMCVTRIDEAELSEDARRTFRAHKREIDDRIRGLVQEGCDDGSLTVGDPRMATFVATGALNWIARWYDPDGPLTPAEAARRCVSVLMDGLDARREAAGAPGQAASRVPLRRRGAKATTDRRRTGLAEG